MADVKKDPLYEPLDPDFELLEKLNAQLKEEPTDGRLWYEKGMQHVWANQNDEAIKSFSRGLFYDPFHARMRFWRARKLMGKGAYIFSAAEMKLAAALLPYDAEIQYYTGVNLYLANMLPEAKEAHGRCRELILKGQKKLTLPATVDWYWTICMKLGEREEAKRVVEKYITPETPYFDWEYLDRDLLYKGYYNPDTFLEDCKDHLKSEDRRMTHDVMLKVGLATYLHFNGDDEKAIPLFKEVAKCPQKTLFAVMQAQEFLKELHVDEE